MSSNIMNGVELAVTRARVAWALDKIEFDNRGGSHANLSKFCQAIADATTGYSGWDADSMSRLRDCLVTLLDSTAYSDVSETQSGIADMRARGLDGASVESIVGRMLRREISYDGAIEALRRMVGDE